MRIFVICDRCGLSPTTMSCGQLGVCLWWHKHCQHWYADRSIPGQNAAGGSSNSRRNDPHDSGHGPSNASTSIPANLRFSVYHKGYGKFVFALYHQINKIKSEWNSPSKCGMVQAQKKNRTSEKLMNLFSESSGEPIKAKRFNLGALRENES